MKRKICVVITARPSYSRIKSALHAICEHPDLELQLVVAASALLDRYGSAIANIQADGFDVAAKVYMVIEGEMLVTSAKTTGLGIVEFATVFDNLKPDLVVTIADRYETMATAIAAAYSNIPLVHIQGGEVTGSIDEKVRHAVTKLADLHLVSTDVAKERVLRMGEEKDSVYVTGCPSIDLAADVLADSALDFDPFVKYGGVGSEVDLSSGYVVVMQHPVTTEHDEALQQVTETLFAVDALHLPALWFWPNVDAGSDATSKGIRAFREAGNGKNIHYFRNMGPHDFLKLLYNSQVLVGNSSVGIRECGFLGIPTVNIGTRQGGRERGFNVVDVPHDRSAIQRAITQQLQIKRAKPSNVYGDGSAGKRIAELLSTCELRIDKRLAY